MDISHSIINSNMIANCIGKLYFVVHAQWRQKFILSFFVVAETFGASSGQHPPNIHPGSIPSTGRTNPSTIIQNGSGGATAAAIIPGLASPLGGNNLNHVFGGFTNGNAAVANQIIMGATPTSTQNVAQHQLIGGAPSPSLITIHTAGPHPPVVAAAAAAAAAAAQATSQVSHLTSLQHSATSASSSNHSGENQIKTQNQIVVPPVVASTAMIEGPMLSAMQQMFSTIDQSGAHHGSATTATAVYQPPNVAAPIYFN